MPEGICPEVKDHLGNMRKLLRVFSVSAMLHSAVSVPQERRVRHDSASVELQACQECLSGCQGSLRGCQAEAARKSAAGAVAEAAFQQALATAEADFRASIQASYLCSCASPAITNVNRAQT